MIKEDFYKAQKLFGEIKNLKVRLDGLTNMSDELLRSSPHIMFEDISDFPLQALIDLREASLKHVKCQLSKAEDEVSKIGN